MSDEIVTEISVTDVILAEGNRMMLEGTVLLMALHEPEFFSKVGTLICENKGALTERDFSAVFVDNKVYEYVRRYWQVFGSASPRPGHLLVFPQLASHLVETGAWLEDEVEEIRTRLTWLVLKPKSHYQPYLSKGPQIVSKWLEEIRTKKLIQKAANNLITHGELADEMVSLRARLTAVASERRTFSFGDGLDVVRPDVKRIPTPWPRVNSVISGYGLGESSLMIAVRGQGKTVLGTQSAAFAALAGYKTLFVTTEQEPWELEPRMVSQFADVPFEKISDGLRNNLRNKCTPSEQERADMLMTQLKPTLKLHWWEKGTSITSGLPALVKSVQDEMGGLDFLVFDWIGKGLGLNESTEASQLRMMYRVAASAVADQAREFNIAVLTFAQANVVQAFNKKLVDDTMVTEHKQIAEDFTCGFGMSAMREGNDESAKISDKQYLNIFKSRKAQGRVCLMERDFAFQRFKDYEKFKK